MKRILIVEDAEYNTDLLVQLLEEDYDLIMTDNGEHGVALAAQERPDLIIMDMSLPVLDGWEATRRIKANKELAHIPIIGLSAHAMTGDAEKAIKAGCDDYLPKPFDDRVLFKKLDQWLENDA